MTRILIIDDEMSILFLLHEILESAGHTVHEAADGAAGLRLFRQLRHELVITDIFMPEQDGLEVILALKREFPGVKIIAISGGDMMFLPMSKTFGADRILPKPFPRQKLLATVQELSEEASFPIDIGAACRQYRHSE